MTITMARKPRRSRVQLSVGGVIYLAVAALMLAMGVYTQANLLFWLLGLMVGGAVVSVLMVVPVLEKVRVQRLVPGHGTAGEELVLRYRLSNASWLPIFSLVITETWGPGRKGWRSEGPLAERPPMLRGRPQGWVMHLGPHQSVQAEAPCWPLRRGELHFERIVLSCAFPFGVVRKVVHIDQPAEVIVYPQLFRLQRRLMQALSDYDPAGLKQLDRGGGMEEFFGLRPYRRGDSLRMIDWKHSARTGDLVSREMTQPSPPRIMVLLDLRHVDQTRVVEDGEEGQAARGADDDPTRADAATALQATTGELSPARRATERTISLAASIVCEAHLQGFQVGLAVAGCSLAPFPVHHSLPHCMKILEALARLDVGASSDPPQQRLPTRPSVIVWPGAGDPPPAPGRRHGTLTFGAADMERYVLVSKVSRELLERRNHLRRRREALEADLGGDTATRRSQDTSPLVPAGDG